MIESSIEKRENQILRFPKTNFEKVPASPS